MTESKEFHSEVSSPNTTTISQQQSQVNESFSSTSETETESSSSTSSSSTLGSSSYFPQLFSSTLNHLNKYLPLISVVIIILASIAIKYLTELELFGLSSPLGSSWGTPVFISTCFLFYSLSLVLISFFISQRFYADSTPSSSSTNCGISSSTTSASTSSNVPSSLSRLRSHFTFLPLTHFIRQHAQASAITSDGISNNQPLNNQPNNTTLHTNGNSTASSYGKELEYTTRLESQRDALVEAIFESCVNPWYERISDERNFPIQTKQILQATFDRLFQKFHQLDRTNLTKEAIEIINAHWKTYCEASKKGSSSEDNFGNHFSYVHNCVVSREDLSKHYETLLYLLLKEFVTPDLQSNLICRFLSGILVKSFFLYYADLITDPKWINTAIYKKLISSDTSVTTTETIISSTGSSQESVFEFPSKVKDDSNSNSNTNSTTTPTNTTKTKIQNQDSDSIDGSCNNVTPASEKGEKEISPNNEEKDLPHQRLTLKDENEKELLPKFGRLTPTTEINGGGGSTVSAALGGLLSATALPLLPEGTINTLKCLEGNNNRIPTAAATTTTTTSNSSVNTIENEKDNAETNKTTSDHLTNSTTNDSTATNNDDNNKMKESTDIKSTTTNTNTTAATNAADGSNTETIETPSTESKTIVSGANRHYSLDDHSTKTKSTLTTGEKGTKSLDETKNTSTVMRQEEFDLSFNDRLQIESSSSTKDVSPCYEEAEDFAATISKLRALLEQRESQKNLMDNMNTTAKENEANIESVFKNTATTPENNGSPENTNAQTTTTTSPVASPAHSNKTNTNNTSHNNNNNNRDRDHHHHHNNSPSSTSSSANSTTRPSLNSQSSASSLGSGSDASSASNATQSWDSERLEKIVDELDETGPVLNRFFLNVTVPKTESCSDSSGQFVLFCIQYEGVYVEENDDGQVKLVLRTTTIKRRFQEFLTLQTQLEESTLWKAHMKGIKPPTKWINLSFSKSLESTNINQRRVALEKYLHQLCYHPVLGFSQQLRNFMAYGEDGFQAFQASDAIPIDRFDKIAKKFTGVFNSLRDALPSFESELLGVPSSPDATNGGKSPITDNKAKSLFASFLRAEKLASASSSSTESIADKNSKLSTETLDSSSSSSTITTSTTNTKSECESKSGLETDNNNLNSNETSDDNTLNNMEPQNIQEPIVEVDQYPLAVAATHLLCDVLWLNRPHAASVSAFLSISGKSFENYLQEFLDIFLSQEAFLEYLEQAAVGIKEWMNEDESPIESEAHYTESDLKDCLKQKIPVWVRFAWGRNRVEGTIARLTKVWQETTLNQDLMLSLVELLFSKLIDTNDSSITHGSNNSSSTTTNGHS